MMNKYLNDTDIKPIWARLEDLREKVKSNGKAMDYYRNLQIINRKDQMYGWVFNENAILEDNLEMFDIYQKPYVLSVFQVYINELENILIKTMDL